jgi:hypothetical protein
MQSIEATICDIPIEPRRHTGNAARNLILGAAAAATVGAIAAYALHARYAPAPVSVPANHAARAALPAPAGDPIKLYGAIVVEPEWQTASSAPAPVEAAPATLASLGLEGPNSAPGASPTPPSKPSASLLTQAVPLPPVRDVPRVDDAAPLPPARPSELVEAPNLVASAPTVAQPTDERNVFQKFFGLGQPGQPAVQAPAGIVASRPPAAAPAPAAVPAPAPTATAAPAATTVARATPDARTGGGGLFGLFGGYSSGGASLDRLGYDRQTAIYDISAKALYLPDGTKIEAHSGLGGALDDVRYVSERAVGPTPPHLYELTMREALFHGVQALRLTPVGGDGSVFGRAGLLAHPYMLGPNGDSNGCVSVKDYEAFLRAYQSGQINKLAVVARL